MIPKKLHYVWCGENKKPESVIKCLNTWKKHCPDWEICEWGNEILNEFDNKYTKQAFKHKKWAFVSDYIRLYVLKKYGGIYLDIDVELTKPLDIFLAHDFFIGCENYKNTFSIGTGLIGATKNHQIINDLLSIYDHLDFELQDGQLDTTPNPKRFYVYFKQHYNLTDLKNGTLTSEFQKNCFIYPWWLFCVPATGKDNYAIHHFNGSWLDTWKRKLIFKIKFGNYIYIFSKFKKCLDNQDKIVLSDDESLLFKFRLSQKRIYCLTIKKA